MEDITGGHTPRYGRRHLLTMGAALVGFSIAGMAPIGSAAAQSAKVSRRSLALHNAHNGETLSVTYWRNGSYIRSALRDIDYLMRDRRNGKTTRIDPKTLDMIAALRARTSPQGRISVISGYRSPETNAMLAARSSGVARKSYHTRGQAVDFYIDGVNLRRLYDQAVALDRGGVGLYTRSNFIHVDSGPVRSWGS